MPRECLPEMSVMQESRFVGQGAYGARQGISDPIDSDDQGLIKSTAKSGGCSVAAVMVNQVYGEVLKSQGP